MPAKGDAAQIVKFMASLAAAVNLDGPRKWWPRYVYHSADVENAASILNCGEILSRAEAKAQGKLVKDCASPRIIAGLEQQDKDWVRLYFRPRAPTQYRNEGIRPVAQHEFDSHMPVPVYFLFASGPFLAEVDTHFTRGRLRSGCPIGSDAKFLQSIPFRDVFHDGKTGNRKTEIVDARHAEVLVPKRRGLDHLKYVVCRSSPELDTLVSLLSPAAAAKWRRAMIVEGGQQRFFYKRGTHVQDVLLEPTHSRFTFYANIAPDCRGPFRLRMDWDYSAGGTAFYEVESYTVGTSPLRLSLNGHHPGYRVCVRLNGDLAYQGDFVETTTPTVLSK